MESNNKVIHYCWFGGAPLSELTKKCIESWKKYLPDFEIKEWNETNFDVNQCEFIKQAYEQKKWAFVADYTRFKVLQKYGGLYLDTDMEITQKIDNYLEHDLFMGQEDSKLVNAAVVWVKEKENKHVNEIVNIYESMESFNATGDLYEISVPQILTKYFSKFGFEKEKDCIQKLDNDSIYIYPMEYFYPLSYDHQHNKFTDNSCMIHHFDATWISPMEKFKTRMKRKNMKWVVYIIDFFVNLKNFFLKYVNYKDVNIFVLTFLSLFLTTCALKPVSMTEIGIFDVINNNFTNIVLTEVLFSIVVTYIFSNVRCIEINTIMDLNKSKKDKSSYKDMYTKLDREKEILGYEKLLFSLQIIALIVLLILPVTYVINLVSFSLAVFSFSLICLTYMIYVGIKKKMKYRILDLVFICILLLISFLTGGLVGILVSIASFTVLLFVLVFTKIARKRLIVYTTLYILLVLVSLAISVLLKINVFSEIGLDVNVNNIANLKNEYLNSLNFDYISSFEFGKNIIQNMAGFKLLNSNVMLIIVYSISMILVCLLSKDYKYFSLCFLALFMNIITNNGTFLLFLNFQFVMFGISLLLVNLFRRVYKNKKIKLY